MLINAPQPSCSLLFPDGTDQQGPLNVTFHIGEKVIIEGQKQYYVVADVQHQFKPMVEQVGTDESHKNLYYRMVNVILKEYPQR